MVLTFFGSAASEKNRKALDYIASRKDFFNDKTASFFGVSVDREDQRQERVKQVIPGYRYFWDFDHKVSELYEAIVSKQDNGNIEYRAFTLVLDPMLRVITAIPLYDAGRHNKELEEVIARIQGDANLSVSGHAPILILPRIFEPTFCKKLISLYQEYGGEESGFMREIDGKTVGVLDSKVKRRKDFSFDKKEEFTELRREIRARINRRLVPEIKKAFQYTITNMERYIVCCYDDASKGFFSPHRDNTTRATMHRRFACTINLNAEDYEGGELRFPEFGQQTYKAPTGGAVIFSCSLLHEATPVTKGTRYAFLPFLYDADGAKLRLENEIYLSKDVLNKNQQAAEAFAS